MKRERVCRDGGFLFLDAMGGAFLVTTAVLLVLMLAAQSLQGLAVWEEKEAARRWFRQRMDAATAEPLPENIQVRDEATPLGGPSKLVQHHIKVTSSQGRLLFQAVLYGKE
jgi:hypothetical protein